MAHKVVQLSGEGKGWSGIGGDVDLCVICMAVSESHGGGGLSPGVAHWLWRESNHTQFSGIPEGKTFISAWQQLGLRSTEFSSKGQELRNHSQHSVWTPQVSVHTRRGLAHPQTNCKQFVFQSRCSSRYSWRPRWNSLPTGYEWLPSRPPPHF